MEHWAGKHRNLLDSGATEQYCRKKVSQSWSCQRVQRKSLRAVRDAMINSVKCNTYVKQQEEGDLSGKLLMVLYVSEESDKQSFCGEAM